MTQDKKSDAPNQTVLDAAVAPRRLKEGLVPVDTGIYLRVEQGPAEHKMYTLSAGGVYVIGREGADIPLDDKKVSRKHAEIGLYGEDAYVIRDLHSTNGTRLNGRPVSEKAKLKHWDLILIGDTALRVSIIDGTIPLS